MSISSLLGAAVITVIVVLVVSVFVVRFDREIEAFMKSYFTWIERVFGKSDDLQ